MQLSLTDNRSWRSLGFGVYALVAAVGLLAVLEGVCRAVLTQPVVNPTFSETTALLRVAGMPGFAEVIVSDPDLFWRLKPNRPPTHVAGSVSGFPIEMTIETNSLGLRGPEPNPAHDGVHILAIGDSCTFGYGTEYEHSWPAQLEGMLNEVDPEREYRVTNAGVPGYSSYQGLRFLQLTGFDLQPDLIIASFGPNDAGGWSSHTDRGNARRIQEAQSPGILGNLRLFWFMADARQKIRTGFLRATQGHSPRMPPDDFRATITEIADECRARGIPLLFMIWPWREQIESGIESMGYQALFEQTAGEIGVPLINCTPVLHTIDGIFEDDLHGTPLGMQIAAQQLLPQVFLMLSD